MMAIDELEELLKDRFNLQRSDLLTALRSLPAQRTGAAELTAEEADLLDRYGLVEDAPAYARAAAEVITHTARLVSTAYSAAEVAAALGVNDSRVRQRRLAGTLWAIDDGNWIYPALQFDTDQNTGRPTRQVRGLEQVFPRLPADLHPAGVAGFLVTPQQGLSVDGRPMSVLQWLGSGGRIEPVLDLVDVAYWAGV